MRRLSHHASIVVWDGCNECQVYMGTDTAVYAEFVLAQVAAEDASRAVEDEASLAARAVAAEARCVCGGARRRSGCTGN